MNLTSLSFNMTSLKSNKVKLIQNFKLITVTNTHFTHEKFTNVTFFFFCFNEKNTNEFILVLKSK